MTDSMPEAPNKSGAILRAAREEMSLSLEQVANELHLRPSVVKAIEDENYSEFSSDVFLKGYFRSYCRLVNLHETRMMELLDQQLLSRKKEAQDKEQLANKIVLAKKRKKLFITFLVFIAGLALVGFAYQMATQNSSTEENAITVTDVSKKTNEEQVISDQNERVEIKNSDAGSDNQDVEIDKPIQSNEYESVQSNDDESLQDSVNGVIEEVNVVSDENLKEESFKQQLEETTEEAEAQSTQHSESDSISIESVLSASFTGDCWFKVTDGTGKTVIAALKKEGSVSNFTGLAPFHIIIGDASKVSLEFENMPVNLSPYTARNGRAELTLKPSDSVSEG